MTTVAMIRTPVTLPTARCEYSMIAWASAGGYGRPLHSGQSGQPSPDPETRTTPPSAICRYANTAASTETRLKIATDDIRGSVSQTGELGREDALVELADLARRDGAVRLDEDCGR